MKESGSTTVFGKGMHLDEVVTCALACFSSSFLFTSLKTRTFTINGLNFQLYWVKSVYFSMKKVKKMCFDTKFTSMGSWKA